MFFGIDPAELVLIIILAVVMFGPERIPQLSRKAARVVVAVRDIANNAQSQLREELGPEYADLSINDLNPKALVRKHLSSEVAAIEEARAELTSVTAETKATALAAGAAMKSAKKAAGEKPALAPSVRFDPEAT